MRQQGVPIGAALARLGVARSTYYAWFSGGGRGRPASVQALLPTERAAILQKKREAPQLRHRGISGALRQEDVCVSPSSCYRVLAQAGLVEPYERRPAPWAVARYEPIGPNRLWGEDWTKLLIDGHRWYLLVVLDLFSRLVVSWEVVRTVTQREVKELIARGMLAQGLDRDGPRPRLRTDCGSPNVAGTVREFLAEIGVTLSLGRVRRPTDNARVERFNGTFKQEEAYCQSAAGYLSEQGARLSIARYMEYYCHRRPHQALHNFTPAYVHQVGNKTQLWEEYRKNVEQARQKRLRHNRTKADVTLSTLLAESV